MSSGKGKKIIAGILAVVAALGVAGYFLAVKFNLKDKLWLSMNVDIAKVETAWESGSLWQVNNEKGVSFYNLDYQETVDKKINKLVKKEKPTSLTPLYIINPYGSNTCSVNVYFTSEEPLRVSYTVSSEGAPDFSENLYNGGG